MIGVGGIIIWRQCRREKLAGTVADLMQEGTLRTLCLPIAKHADARSVGQAEGDDVDSVSGGMFAELPRRAAVEPAA